MTRQQYGDVLIVFEENGNGKHRDEIIRQYEEYVKRTRQPARKARDIKKLAALDPEKKYSAESRQWAGHKYQPDQIRAKNSLGEFDLYYPVFVSEVIKWN